MKKILVIDDEKEIRDNISKILAKKGITVTTVDNVIDAEKLIKKKTWDAIICDIMIPHLGGFELMDLAKEVSEAPVIIVTGLEKDIVNSTMNSADIIITKPFSGKDILDAIESVGIQV
jgi:DNA-binding response OmpR family regulator